MARGIETKCLHLEEEEGCGSNYGAVSYPIYQTATYAHPGVGKSTGYDYSRLQNPIWKRWSRRWKMDPMRWHYQQGWQRSL